MMDYIQDAEDFHDYLCSMNQIHKINGGDIKVITNNYKECCILFYGLSYDNIKKLVKKFEKEDVYEVIEFGNLFIGLKIK